MAAVTLLGSATFNTNSGSKAVTATPSAGDHIIIITAHTGNDLEVIPTDDNGDSGVYVLVETTHKAASVDGLRCYVRDRAIANAVSTTFTHNPGTTTGGGLAVIKTTGMSRFGSSSVRQFSHQGNQGTGGTPAPTMPAACLTGNVIIGAVFNGSSPATITPRTGYTELADVGYSTPTTGLEVMALASGETSTVLTWGSTSTGSSCDLVAELDTSASTTGQIKVWNGSAFVAKPVKVWNGAAWVTKPLKRWNGSSWVVTPY